ncbi:MAG: SUMF1/EgtB/PvdO family nonheme iron enzyme [Anaerolineae bacterium]
MQQREDLAASDSHSRVLRGGSFGDDDESYLRCAARNFNNPYHRDDVIGFRVCASPLPLSSGASGL